ncbi:MAG: hypothetical protein KAI93_17205, partial [Desulfobacterales bacterium]|nr:hypothetical protein [Desulfobacterales bacterium]
MIAPQFRRSIFCGNAIERLTLRCHCSHGDGSAPGIDLDSPISYGKSGEGPSPFPGFELIVR